MDDDIIDISSGVGYNNNISSKYGSGIDLLMNNKQRTNNNSRGSEVNIEDITDLENELNDLSGSGRGGGGMGPEMEMDFGEPIKLSGFDSEPSHVRFNDNSSLGESTFNLDMPSKTWDGYGKFNEIPMSNPDANIMSEPKMSSSEVLREKIKYIRKFETLEKKGVQMTKKYDMDSNLNEMKAEYDMIMDEKVKQNSIKFQANMLMTVINGIEFLNQRFDPFDVNLDGWGEQVQENISDYDEVFGALHDKWKNKANISPELQLLFQLGGSAMMVHMTNSLFKTSMPNMDDILKQNPDLMRQFQSAAVNTMNNTNPGLSSYMSNFTSAQPPHNQQRPPSPLQTKKFTQGMRDNVRPDISMARGVFEDGVDIRDTSASVSYGKSARKEMKGPSDLSDILSGLKTKKISVDLKTQQQPQTQQPQQRPQSRNTTPRQHQQQTQQQTYANVQIDDDFEEEMPTIQLTSLNTIDYNTNNNANGNDDSRISIDDMKSIEGNFNLPKKSKRRPKSDKSTINLDL